MAIVGKQAIFLSNCDGILDTLCSTGKATSRLVAGVYRAEKAPTSMRQVRSIVRDLELKSQRHTNMKMQNEIENAGRYSTLGVCVIA